MGKASIKFFRLVRTPSSENWRIDSNNRVVGFLHLHFAGTVYGDLIITKKISAETLEVILDELDSRLVDSVDDREDFVFSVFNGEEIAFYSDIVDHNLSPPTKKDLDEQKKLISTFLSKYQEARGQLNEHVVKEYFIKLGYHSVKTDARLDQLKVDVIAEGVSEIIYCQVKLGKIDERKIMDVAKSVSNIGELAQGKRLIIAIVADSFPTNIEVIKDNVESRFNLKLRIIFKSQILTELPEYKRSLKG
jgi:hypothetical protein